MINKKDVYLSMHGSCEKKKKKKKEKEKENENKNLKSIQ